MARTSFRQTAAGDRDILLRPLRRSFLTHLALLSGTGRAKALGATALIAGIKDIVDKAHSGYQGSFLKVHVATERHCLENV